MEKVITINEKKMGKWIIAGVIGVFIIILAVSSFVVVPAGHTGVVLTFGKVSEDVLQEGLHFKIPFVHTVENISNKIQVEQVDSEAVSSDLQAVSSTIAVDYRVGLDSSANIFKNIERNYQIVLLPAIHDSVKSVTARYRADELINKRAIVGQEIKDTLEKKVEDYGIIIQNFNIVNFGFTAEFNAINEAKQVAEQTLIKTETEQKQAIMIQEAEAKKKIIAAEAEAEAILKTAEAQAESNILLAASISNLIIEYQKIQKWDGRLPLATSGDAILDFRSILEDDDRNGDTPGSG